MEIIIIIIIILIEIIILIILLLALMSGFRSNAKEKLIQDKVKQLHDRFLTSPDDLNSLFNTAPELAEAIVSGNKAKVESIVRKQVEDA